MFFFTALFPTTKKWKQPKRPLIDECMNKMWYIHTLEYLSALKKEENSKTFYTWMKFEKTVLNETDQSQKNKHCVIPLI